MTIPEASFIVPASDGWHRPSKNFYPKKLDEDLLSICEGWLPPRPFITRQHLITTFGSCFAQNIDERLHRNGYRTTREQYAQTSSLLVKCGEGFVNTYSIFNQLEWLWEDAIPHFVVWLKHDGSIQKWMDDSKEAGLKIINETDVFIISLGLAEIAYHKRTGEALWAGVPEKEWQTGEYDYRLTTIGENHYNLDRIVELIRRHRGNVPIVLTLSPIPLLNTFRPVSCLTANCVSKSILRAAIDATMHLGDPHLFYWPAYEMVTAYAANPWREPDPRHPKNELIDEVCAAFMKAYCE